MLFYIVVKIGFIVKGEQSLKVEYRIILLPVTNFNSDFNGEEKKKRNNNTHLIEFAYLTALSA
jgi:hypothetical protein